MPYSIHINSFIEKLFKDTMNIDINALLKQTDKNDVKPTPKEQGLDVEWEA